MNKNYMTYPLEYMRVTCTYKEGSHKDHTTGNYRDYPIDDGGLDTKKSPIYCPCDEMKIVEIKGIDNKGVTNTIWLESTKKVIKPTFNDYVFMTLTHSDDNDIRNLKKGQTFKRGEIICYEGTDGATANHIHLVTGRGKCNSWIYNSNNKLVMKGDSKKPEDIFFIDRNFTKELWGGYLIWKDLPTSNVENNTIEEQLELANKKIKDLENSYPRLIFECLETNKYLIRLKKGNNPPTGNGFVGGNATTYFKDCNSGATLWSGTVSSSGSNYSYSTVSIPIASLRSSGKDLTNVQIVVTGGLSALYYGSSSVTLDNVAINGTGNKLSAASGALGWSVGSANYGADHDWGSKNYSLFTGTYNMIQVKTLSFSLNFSASDNGNGRGSGNATVYLKDCNSGSNIWSTYTSGQNDSRSISIPVETLVKSGKDLTNIQIVVAGTLSSTYYAGTSISASNISYSAYTLPSITSNISDVTINVGEDANFEVTATNTIKYQWQYTIDGVTWNNISDATTKTFNITNVPYTYNKYKYRCVLTGSFGDINSDEAILTVNDNIPPTISVKSDAIGQVSGQIITVTAVDTGSGLADKAYAMIKLGEDSIEYVSSNKFTISQNGTYVFYSKDKAGNVSTATLVVTNIDITPPTVNVKTSINGLTITEELTAIVIAKDDGVGLHDEAYVISKIGETPTNWQKDNTFLITTNDTYIFYARDKVGNIGYSTLTITNIKTLAEQGLKKYYILPNGSLVDDKEKLSADFPDIKIEFKGKGATSGEIIVDKDNKVVNAVMVVSDYTINFDGEKYMADTSRPSITFSDNVIHLKNDTLINAFQITKDDNIPSSWISIDESLEKDINIKDFDLSKGTYYIWCKSSNNIVSDSKKIEID